MTTIAFRDGIVVADSRANRGGWLNTGDVVKLYRVKDGVCAIEGAAGATTALRSWLERAEGEKPKMTGDASVIHIRNDGVITVHEAGGEEIQPGPFMAWGSGAPIALGAMYAGATAKQAVEIAAKVDPYTGGRIVVMPLKRKPITQAQADKAVKRYKESRP